MNEQDTKRLLGYVQAADNRNVTPADIVFWMETLPEWLDLDTAKAAVRMFFTEPERNAESSVYFTTRHLIRCAKQVRRLREIEAARERAKTPAIEQATKPPAEGWRARVPGGYPEPAEEAAEPHKFTDEERAANRLKLNRMMNPRNAAERDGRPYPSGPYNPEPNHLTAEERAAGLDGK